jgi:dipeptidyl aminopeptidase/acylaminoacyl peptidase
MSPDGTNPRQIWTNKDDFTTRWSADGKGLIYHSVADKQYYLYSLATGESRQITDEPSVGGMVGVSADGQWIAFQPIPGLSKDLGARAAPVSGGPSRIPVPSHAHWESHPFFSPSGGWFYFQSEHKNLYRVPGPAQAWKTAPPEKVTDFPETADFFMEDPQFSADGKQLLFSLGKAHGDIWILTRDK